MCLQSLLLRVLQNSQEHFKREHGVARGRGGRSPIVQEDMYVLCLILPLVQVLSQVEFWDQSIDRVSNWTTLSMELHIVQMGARRMR